MGLHAAADDLQTEYGRNNDPGHEGRDQRILDVVTHYTFSTSGLPSKPVGRNSSMKTSSRKATISLYWDEIYAAAKVSAKPRSTPPSMAPGMLPIPPSTAAVHALMPAMKPMKGLSLPMASAISTPPTAASIAPMMKVKEMIRLVSMPSKFAMRKSWEQARDARPIREYLMNNDNAIISSTVTTMIMIREYGAVTTKSEPNWNWTEPVTSAGTAMSRAPWPIATQFCRKMDMPMADMSGTRRGPPRKGA